MSASTTRRLTGRDAFLQLLLDEGVTHLFGNPGTTELAIMEAVPHFPALTYVLGLQESVVLGMADGFARASGRLAAVNLHCAPGLGHAMGALYSAKFSGSPVIITAGQYEIGYGLQEPLLYEPLVPLAQPLVKWAVEVTRIEDLPRIVRRAAKIAMTPPMGPVFISLPGSILDDEADLDLGHPTRVDASSRPSDATLLRLADRLLAAERPVMIAGRELASRDVFDEAGVLAMLTGLVKPGGDLFVSTINRNAKSFALAIVGAEYLLRLLPRGTHDYSRFIRPAELARWARGSGFDVVDLAGLDYDPFTGRCHQSKNLLGRLHTD